MEAKKDSFTKKKAKSEPEIGTKSLTQDLKDFYPESSSTFLSESEEEISEVPIANFKRKEILYEDSEESDK